VQTHQDFEAFLRCLVADLRQRPGGWENATLDSYLEAMRGWTVGTDGFYSARGEARPAQPPWQVLARMLLAARVHK